MLEINTENKNIIKFVIVVLCLLAGVLFVKVFQQPEKTDRIYKQALKDYQNKNYQNSYYLFSKISPLSRLKQAALYRQAMCAKALGDKNSELKVYRNFLQKYPVSKLTAEVKYEAGQLLVETSPKYAAKYFKDVIRDNNIDENYKIASSYYLAKIAAFNTVNPTEIKSSERNSKINDAFRQYLEKFPDGRLAPKVADDWLKFNPDMGNKNKILCALAYSLAGFDQKSDELLTNIEDKYSWSVKALNAYARKDDTKANALVEFGVKYSAPNTDIYKRVVNEYINSYGNRADKLFSLANGESKDYIWNLKCEEESEKGKCYSELYQSYPDSEYAKNALLNIFLDNILKKQYDLARSLGQQYLLKYQEDDESSPFVLFWLGKISQKYNTSDYIKYYQDIINNYPDTYYAYRAFWILKGINSPTIGANLKSKPVIYPYKFPRKNSMLYSLINVGDYDMLTKFSDDEFIKSWVEYQKGNYWTSAHIAQKAMEKIKEKPLKSDIRWRLVYPSNYYKHVQMYSQNGNNEALIMAIIREESFFNMNAQSSVGAIGLMQLMPSTAHEIGDKYGITFNNMGLFNPELNIKLGNLYYSTLLELFNNNDIYCIAAYNGGAGAVSSWKSKFSTSDIDEFVETIPYEETKNYVKKVMRSYWNYMRIYQQ